MSRNLTSGEFWRRLQKRCQTPTVIGFQCSEVRNLCNSRVYTLDSSGFGVIAIAAIQEMLDLQNAENARLRAENEAMQQQINSLAQRLDQLENR